MDAKLLGKLTRAEEDLVSAMLTGDVGLVACGLAWTSLLDEISQASASGEINSTTLAVADDVVARVSTLVECCLTLSSVPPPSFPILNLNIRSRSAFHSASSFIIEAYSWLVENVSNPYPSSDFKVSLAQRYNTPVSAVSSWFANARRRIGWTTLCRDFFRNCRADAVDAACRVLVMGDPDHQGPEITHAFVAMKVTAEELYSTSTKSALVGDLDTVLKDMLPEDKVLPRDGGRGGIRKIECLKTRKHSTCTLDVSSQKKLARQIHYPPSDLSYSSAPVPGFDDFLTNESEDEDDTSPPLLAGRKRRLSLSEPAHRVATGSVKRPRLSSSPNACLPSTSTTTEDPSENGSQGQMPRSVPVTQSFADSKTRKRRLSDADADAIRPPKRPRDSMAGPRPHSVSDPLPLSTLESEVSIDEWFKTNFDALFALPPPVDVVEPDLSTQWEIELFNNYSIPENPQKVFTPPIQDNQILSSTDLTALDDLLQSLETGGFVTPPEIMQPPTMVSVTDPVSLDLPLLPDLSQTIDWTGLFNEDPSEPTYDPMFPRSYVNSALHDNDLSALQLPHVWTTVTS